MKEQSDQGLHCLPFCLHLLDAFFYGKVFKFYENYTIFFFKSECLEFLWKVKFKVGASILSSEQIL